MYTPAFRMYTPGWRLYQTGVYPAVPPFRTVCRVKGYGILIAEARIREGLTPEELARRLGKRSKTIVYKLESEQQEPTADQVNALAAALPLSVEQLLKAMGVALTPPAAARLPRRLVQALLAMPPQRLAALTELVDPAGDPDTRGSVSAP